MLGTVLSALCEFSPQSCGAGIYASLQMRKVKHEELKELARDYTLLNQPGFKPQFVKLQSSYCLGHFKSREIHPAKVPHVCFSSILFHRNTVLLKHKRNLERAK